MLWLIRVCFWSLRNSVYLFLVAFGSLRSIITVAGLLFVGGLIQAFVLSVDPTLTAGLGGYYVLLILLWIPAMLLLPRFTRGITPFPKWRRKPRPPKPEPVPVAGPISARTCYVAEAADYTYRLDPALQRLLNS